MFDYSYTSGTSLFVIAVLQQTWPVFQPFAAMLNDDLGALMGGALAAGSSQRSTQGEGPAEKRRKLRHYDLLPAQLLNSMGASGIETVDLPRLWRSMSAGNKATAAFSELCLGDAERQGVGLSRFAEVMVLTIKRLLETPHYEQCLKDDLWQAVKRECQGILPHFQAIHAGRGGMDGDSASIRSVAYHRPAAQVADLTDHVTAVHAWLTSTNSPTRAVIALFSAGGLFYVAQCHEKGARAWLVSGGGSLEAMRAAVNARRAAPTAAGPDDYSGLSQQEL